MKAASYIAAHLRTVLKNGGSAPHTEEVQHFFKHEITSRGWYTAEIRKLARRFTKILKNDAGLDYLVEVADQLFNGDVLEEKVLAVFLLEKQTKEFGDKEFRRFESWLPRVSAWADHDGLVHNLIGPLMLGNAKRQARTMVWTKSKNRWHRRAAAVSLIRVARLKESFVQVRRVTEALIADEDDMVRKGLGWLLREAAKADAKTTLPYLMKLRKRAPRLVLRTACETLVPKDRARVLGRAVDRRIQ
ncbi:MAG TPA: DNA alkylation repair protein [Candidatus Koribacter sp.]|jgi:3-methyladenine DNA glycosylase AlkD